jgi:NADPH:quinone reductase-like Zn-dependent oxidoreductase
MGNRQDLTELCTLIEQGKIKPSIGTSFPFKDIQKAHQILENNQQMGKVVITF